jgi:hypothetical protein
MAKKESREDLFRRKVAAWLGISFEELEEYGEDIAENNGDYGNRAYAFVLPFSPDTPPEILDKIRRISKRGIVYFNLEELDNEGG